MNPLHVALPLVLPSRPANQNLNNSIIKVIRSKRAHISLNTNTHSVCSSYYTSENTLVSTIRQISISTNKYHVTESSTCYGDAEGDSITSTNSVLI